MTPKFFLFVYFSAVAFVVLIMFVSTYFEIQKIYDGVRPETAAVPRENQKTVKPSSAAPQKEAVADIGVSNISNISKTPPSNEGGTGNLKNIAADGSEITITGNGQDFRAKITPTTEIFRNSKRAQLSDIQDTDIVTILGLRKTADGQANIADSIYANSVQEIYEPITPVTAPEAP